MARQPLFFRRTTLCCVHGEDFSSSAGAVLTSRFTLCAHVSIGDHVRMPHALDRVGSSFLLCVVNFRPPRLPPPSRDTIPFLEGPLLCHTCHAAGVFSLLSSSCGCVLSPFFFGYSQGSQVHFLPFVSPSFVLPFVVVRTLLRFQVCTGRGGGAIPIRSVFTCAILAPFHPLPSIRCIIMPVTVWKPAEASARCTPALLGGKNTMAMPIHLHHSLLTSPLALPVV